MSDSLNNQLGYLLKESYPDVCIRETETFNSYHDKISSHGLVLFGAGGFGKRTQSGLRQLGIEPKCFTDNNNSLWNQEVNGILVLSPADAVKKYPESLFVVTIWSDVIGHPVNEIDTLLRYFNPEISLISFYSLFWKYPEVFLPYFGIDLPNKTLAEAEMILQANSLWKDLESQNEFLSQIRWRLWFDYNSLPLPKSYTQYFPDDILKLSAEEVFIDCGAFDGDTLRNFLDESSQLFKSYVAFEPDPENFIKLNESISRLDGKLQKKISAFPWGLSNTSRKIKFNASGTLQSSESSEGNIEIECVSLDDKFFQHKPSYIKIDAEGAEPEIIDGAVKIIREYSPIIAISVYHVYNHLWKLPLKIFELNQNYRFYLRSHCKACWDLVCYAIPESRIIKSK
jgi:FkbM family methyltransferase